MLAFILGYVLIIIIWAILSGLAIRQVYQYAYRTDTLSRALTIVYLIISLAIVINGLRIIIGLNFDHIFV